MMNFFSKTGIITFIFIGIISFTLITGCVSESKPRFCLFHSSYDLTINVSEPITNVTIYVPLPVKNGTPMVGIMQLDKSQFTKSNFSIDFVQSPPGMNMVGVYPLPNNQPWFLKITADRINPDPTGNAEYVIGISNGTESPSPSIFLNTLYPVGNESVLLPKLNFSPPVREKITSRSPEWIEYAPFQVSQTTLIYADYSASPSAKVEINAFLDGFNSWVEPHTPRLDGGGNSYDDSYSWSHTGDSHGWQSVKGTYKSTDGVYPNFAYPIW
ncbi:MAG: hypothetical protein WCX63_01455 [Methanoregula sp.]|jgi:hypothetical protein